MAPPVRLIRRFAETLGLLDKGVFENRVNAAWTDAIENLENQPTEKGKATFTVTFDVAFDKGMMQIVPSIKCKLPEAERSGATIFWVHQGALSTQHPSQIDLEEAIREAPRPAQTIVSAG